MTIFVVLTVLLGAVGVAIWLAKAQDSKAAASPFRRKALLTDNEKEFFARLCEALPEHHVFPQVAMGALLCVHGTKPGERLAVRARFAQKIVDYVICDQSLKVVALVELDDRTHNANKDAARDAMTSSAGYRTLRYNSREKPTPRVIARDFRRAAQRPGDGLGSRGTPSL